MFSLGLEIYIKPSSLIHSMFDVVKQKKKNEQYNLTCHNHLNMKITIHKARGKGHFQSSLLRTRPVQ